MHKAELRGANQAEAVVVVPVPRVVVVTVGNTTVVVVVVSDWNACPVVNNAFVSIFPSVINALGS